MGESWFQRGGKFERTSPHRACKNKCFSLLRQIKREKLRFLLKNPLSLQHLSSFSFMQILRPTITFDRFIRGILFLLFLAAIWFTLRWLSPILVPFLVAWVGAWMLIPVVKFFEQRCRIKFRPLSALLAVVSAALLGGGVLWLFAPILLDSIDYIKESLLLHMQRSENPLGLPPWLHDLMSSWIERLNLEGLLREKSFINAIRTAVPQVWDVLLSTADVMLSLLGSTIGFLYFMFLLLDYERFAHGWLGYVPRAWRGFLGQLMGDVEEGMRGYFRGQALIALSNALMFTIGFWIIDLPMPIGMGCLVGLISFVPYLQVLGFLPAALLALIQMSETGRSFWWIMLLVLIVYVVVQIIQDVVFTPRIMGKIMGLNPAIILLSLSIWGYVGGIVGLIVALPLTTILIDYYKRYIIEEREATPESEN